MANYLRLVSPGSFSRRSGFVGTHFLAAILAYGIVASGCSANITPAIHAGDAAADSKGDTKPAVQCSDAGSGTKGRAESCSCGSECRSGYCVNNLCCDSACTDGCKTCSLPSSLGICAFIPAGVKPTDPSFCAAEAQSTCGQDGTCDGVGACRKYEEHTLCKNGTCEGDGVVNAKACDGKGSCSEDVNVPCAPYTCDPKTSQCAGQCTDNSLCAADQTCSASRCGLKLNGFPCPGGNDDCASGHCADGYCCNVACTGACLSCKEADSVGRCKLLGAGVPDSRCPANDVSTCDTTGLCDGAGACALFPENTPCGAASCAASVTQNTARVCDGQGTCQDAQVIDCSPFLCSNSACTITCLKDSDCESGHQCVQTTVNNTTTGRCGKGKPGVPCTDPSECESDQCVDGVCCQSSCGGACRSCNLPGSPGQCLSVAAGAADPRNGCKDLGKESCGTDGLCDGAGGCQMYAPGTVCGTESCVQGAHTPAPTCNQSGQCVTPPSLTCNPFICNGASCFNACANDTQCVTGNYCVNGSCGLIPNGGECSTGSKCQSGHCAQGVCCNSDCTDACMACNLTSSLGKCTAVADNAPDPQEKCKVTLQNTCGTTGACKAGVCADWDKGKNCAPAACATNTSATPASTCDGAGKCVTPSNIDCGNYICNVTNKACNNSCQSNGDCKSPNTCSNGSCGLISNGGACASGNQCASGFCTEGVCCDSACSDAATGGLCKSCKVAGNVGKCSNVASGQSDPKQRCAASNPGAGDCSNDGTCNGNGACRPWLSSVGCRSASCTGTTLTAAANCDGAGHCPAASTSSCTPYQCSSTSPSCLTTCSSDANCVSGETCRKVDNHCGNKLPAGQTCGAGTDCGTGNCVDSTCCGSPSCNDNLTCTTDSCATNDGTCKHTLIAGNCLIEGVCYAANATNPNNSCQQCTPATSTSAWSPKASTTTCDDGSACTTGDHCSNGSCVGTGSLACNDGNACTDDSCDPKNGCVHTNNTADCSDNNACTVGDKCSGGACVPGTAKNCDDGNVCTTDGCDATTGACTHTNNTADCSDNNACTTGDKCSGGTCVPGTAKSCDDGNPCTTDGCNASTGLCAYTNNTASCATSASCQDLHTGLLASGTCSLGTCNPTPQSCLTGYLCARGACVVPGSCTGPGDCDTGYTCDSSGNCTLAAVGP